MLLMGKNAIITGSSRGIGAATVEAFVREGANVWACARQYDEEFERRLNALRKQRNSWIKPIYFDIADSNAMKNAIKSIRAERLPVDILVNNAGIATPPALFGMTPLTTFREVFDINYFAQIELMQYVLRIMDRQTYGIVVNVTSIAGVEGSPGQAEYGASKAALALTSKKLAAEYGLKGIRVNAVAPGVIETDMGDLVADEATTRLLGSSALSRLGRAEEVANAIVFLSSDLSSFITGQIIRVDGGVGLAVDRLTN